MRNVLAWVATAGLPADSYLAAQLERPYEAAEPHARLITIARYTEVWEAHILRARLEAEGIVAILADQHLIAANWFYSNAIGGVRVQVRAVEVRQAREVLAALERGDYALGEESAPLESVPSCPRCGGTALEEHASTRKLALLSLCLLQIPLPFSRWKSRCRDCGHAWREAVPDGEAGPEAAAGPMAGPTPPPA